MHLSNSDPNAHNSEHFHQNYFKFSWMMHIGVKNICRNFLCKYTSTKKLSCYMQQLSLP